MDKHFMQLAIDEAKKANNLIANNPYVGAVIVKNNKVIGKGYHQQYGEPHAETRALHSATEAVIGASIYVTLEPCVHQGKTGPCSEAIIAAGLSRVVIACLDPNPFVAGKGVTALEAAGIEVQVGICKQQAKELNSDFFKHIQTGIPYVTLKSAMTVDGKIACASHQSKWISGEQARNHVQYLRNKTQAICIGVNTVIDDDPSLTCRLENGNTPIKIIFDSNLRTPLTSKLVQSAMKERLIIVTCSQEQIEVSQYLDLGVEIITVDKSANRIDLVQAMNKLGELKIKSILLEAGSTLAYSMLDGGHVDQLVIFVAPKIIGGENSFSLVGGSGRTRLEDAIELSDLNAVKCGDDLMLSAKVSEY